jgi:glyceraldehyde-3-phosphate dehydrogenase (NADP+)
MKISEPLEQKEYLVNGQLRVWQGKNESVYSALTTNKKQSYLGSYPWTGAKEAMEILDAADNSYNKGQGIWAQKSPEKRIGVV